jgi:peptidoglycan hydrolase-like protein with peptidoglycan-binding domain
MRIVLFIASLALGLSALAATVDDGEHAYDQGDFSVARTILLPYADAGNRDAQYLVGKMRANGDGTLQDYVPAHKWLNLAAADGHREARRLRDKISARMTTGQLAEAQREARNFSPRPLPTGVVASKVKLKGAAAIPRRAAPKTTARREVIRDIQSYLSELGYDPGPADGVMGARTRTAMRAYQSHSGLAVSGQPSESLRTALAVDLGYADPDPMPFDGTNDTASAGTASSASQVVTDDQSSTNEPVYVREARVASSHGASATANSNQAATRTNGGAVEELRTIVSRAETNREADREVFTALNALIERHETHSVGVIVDENFSDGDYARNPRWLVSSGKFWVTRDDGLRTEVTSRSQAQGGFSTSGSSGKDVGLALLGALLSQGKSASKTTSQNAASSSGSAEITLPVNIPAAFSLETRLLSGERSGHLEVGLYASADAVDGYRLVYMGTSRRNLQLIRVERGQEALIAFYDRPINFEDGREHRLAMKRSSRGRIEIAVDSRPVLRVIDSAFGRGLRGFKMTNRGGNYALRGVVITGN